MEKGLKENKTNAILNLSYLIAVKMSLKILKGSKYSEIEEQVQYIEKRIDLIQDLKYEIRK